MYYRQRVKLERVQVTPTDGGGRAEVELLYNERAFVGYADAEVGALYDEPRLVARATFAAAEKLVGPRMSLGLDSLQALRERGNHIVLLTAFMNTGEETVPLIGTCRILDEDVRTATARAALNAINRFIDFHLADRVPDGSTPPAG